MPLEPTVISVPLGEGIDTRNNPVLVGQQSLVSASNVRFTKGPLGELPPRNGYQALPNLDTAGNAIANGNQLATLGAELDLIAGDTLVVAPQALYGYAPTQDGWVRLAPITNVTDTLTPVVKNGYSQSVPDAAYVNGLIVYAWIDTRGGVWAKVVDPQSGTILLPDQQLSATGTYPRVTSSIAGIDAIVWFSDTDGNIYYTVVNTENATATLTPVILGGSTGATASTIFDVAIVGSDYFVGFEGGTFSNTIVAKVSSAFSVVTSITQDSNPPLTIALLAGQSSTVVVAYSIAGNDIKAAFLTTSLTGTTYTSSVGHPVYSLGIILEQGSTTTYQVFYQVEHFSTSDRQIFTKTCDSGTGFAGGTTFLRGVGLVSRPFTYSGAGVNYLLIAYASGSPQSTVQNTYFLVTTAGSIVGRYISLDAGTFPQVDRLTTPMNFPTSGMVGIAVQVETTLESAGGTLVVLDGLDLLTLNFTPQQIQAQALGLDLSISGGLPLLYDGQSVFENGFNVFPEKPTVTLLTSQIGMVNYIDGNLATPGQVTVVFPFNPNGSGNDGQLITAGEFIQFVVTGVSAIYFTVDGVGSAPVGNYSGTYPCAISQSDSALTIAKKFAAVCVANTSNILGTGSTYTQNGNQVTLIQTPPTPGFWFRPALNRQFEVNTFLDGVGGTESAFWVTPVSGQFIQGGQYFAFQTIISSVAVPVYCWFTVNGIGTDPLPFAGIAGTDYFSISVPILSSYVAYAATGNSVSHSIAVAINAVSAADLTAYDSTRVSPASDFQYVAIYTNNNGVAYPGATNPGSVAPWTVGDGLGATEGVPNGGQQASYAFCAMYESVDAQGQLHRSSPSVPATLTWQEYGNANAVVSVQTTMLRLTARTSVDIAFYATQDNGQLLYRFSSPTALIKNDPTTDYVSCVDNVPDSILGGNELLYSQFLLPNQVIPNNCPPPFTQLAIFQDQLWINDCEDPQLWWFSKAFSNGVAVEFSDEQTVRFAPTAGPTVAALVMDTNLIVFGTTGIWAVSGLGPDSTGNGGGFNITLVSAAAGCRDPGSIVLTPNGIVFKSAKGFILLDRSLQVHPEFGNPVFTYNADVVTAAQAVPNTNEIRFLSEAGTTQLYDYRENKWSPHSNQGVASIVFNGVYWFLTGSSANAAQEVSGYYADLYYGQSAAPFTYSVTSSWLKPSAVQGWGRLWRVYLQGLFPSSIGVKVQIAYDYNPTIVDTFTVTPGSQEIQIPFFNSIQQLEAVQITVSDTGTLSTSAKMALNSIDLEMGLNKGIYKGFSGAYQYPQSGT